MSLRQKQCAFTRYVAALIGWATSQGYELALKEVLRPLAQQRLYVQQGLSRTLASQHLKGLAVDVALFRDGRYQTTLAAYQPLGEYWCSLAPVCVWGGHWVRFPDAMHFEVKG